MFIKNFKLSCYILQLYFFCIYFNLVLEFYAILIVFKIKSTFGIKSVKFELILTEINL